MLPLLLSTVYARSQGCPALLGRTTRPAAKKLPQGLARHVGVVLCTQRVLTSLCVTTDGVRLGCCDVGPVLPRSICRTALVKHNSELDLWDQAACFRRIAGNLIHTNSTDQAQTVHHNGYVTQTSLHLSLPSLPHYQNLPAYGSWAVGSTSGLCKESFELAFRTCCLKSDRVSFYLIRYNCQSTSLGCRSAGLPDCLGCLKGPVGGSRQPPWRPP